MGYTNTRMLCLLLGMFIVFNFANITIASDGPEELINHDKAYALQVEEDLEINEFFRSFDRNNNEKLEWSEAESFYNWVRRNVEYRYDDENEIDPIGNYLIGDGRVGSDYQQIPEETYKELAGDCEDQNGLEVAFFKYWGFESKIGIVKIKDNDYHAFALVKIDDLNFAKGKIFYYEIDSLEAKYYKLSPGKYIVVDNTFSKRIGEFPSDIVTDTRLLYTKSL